jgi:spore photoproduct lyase
MAAEVIFLMHNNRLHDGQPRLAPVRGALLWTPEIHERTRSQTGGRHVRSRRGWKGARARELLAQVERRTPGLRVR